MRMRMIMMNPTSSEMHSAIVDIIPSLLILLHASNCCNLYYNILLIFIAAVSTQQ